MGDNIIDRPIRSFIFHLHRSKQDALWATAKHTKETFHTQRASIDHMGASLVHIKGYRCITWQRNSLWSFTIKLINRILPTLDILELRYPLVYTNWNCPSCHEEKESILHLITCKALEPHWTKVNTCIRDFIEHFTILSDLPNKFTTLMDVLNARSSTLVDSTTEWNG